MKSFLLGVTRDLGTFEVLILADGAEWLVGVLTGFHFGDDAGVLVFLVD